LLPLRTIAAAYIELREALITRHTINNESAIRQLLDVEKKGQRAGPPLSAPTQVDRFRRPNVNCDSVIKEISTRLTTFHENGHLRATEEMQVEDVAVVADQLCKTTRLRIRECCTTRSAAAMTTWHRRHDRGGANRQTTKCSNC